MSIPELPHRSGIGLRSVHYRAMLDQLPNTGWLEAHSENYFGDGGQPLHFLEKLREHYPLSFHGVGLSIGSADELNRRHLQKLKRIVDWFEPALVSEHLSWGAIDGRYLNELLPLPYTEDALNHICNRVEQVQNYLGRQILVENVSSYLQYHTSTIPEWEFVAAVAQRTGCGLLLDVNNIYVNAFNHHFDPHLYLAAIPPQSVKEIHLAGFDDSYGDILIDTHGNYVADAVWELYAAALQRFGRVPTLIEWDTDIPELSVLLAEAQQADEHMEACYDLVA